MDTAKTYFLILFLFSLLLPVNARAERPEAGNPYNFIAGHGSYPFGQGGAFFLPLSVLNGLKNGQLSPVMQFVLINDMMTKCVKNAAKDVPARRDPFVTANKKFQLGYCKIRKCFEQGMILGMLSQLSSNPNYGGSSDAGERQGSLMMVTALASSFKKESSCDGNANSNVIDPAILQVIGN